MEPPARPASAAPDLSGMTRAALLAYADENGVAGAGGSMRKADIIAAIEEARK